MVNVADQTISLNGWSLDGWMLSIVDNNCLRVTKGTGEWVNQIDISILLLDSIVFFLGEWKWWRFNVDFWTVTFGVLLDGVGGCYIDWKMHFIKIKTFTYFFALCVHLSICLSVRYEHFALKALSLSDLQANYIVENIEA